ncbi:galactokinase [Kitasatospora sp. NPDC002227]|uniref:galactokinase n=1 Tax=Kitasatospora sp. NPDC002227 TaxID=3154773 RepID=UPI0033188C94
MTAGIEREFHRMFGAAPEGVWAAPGRVNLIGEHTDYNDGFALPIALPHTTRVAARRRSDGLLRLHSGQADPPPGPLAVAELAPGTVSGWARYPAGVLWALRAAGHPVGGADLYVTSDVPPGAGLSSSAALECATALALRDLHRLPLSGPELALIAQRAEHLFAGVPCGAMDQLASACCTVGHALLLDTRSLGLRHIPVDLEPAGLSLLVVDTRVKHDLGDGAYAELRQGCERAAGLLGVAALRDLTTADLGVATSRLPAELLPLVRHVVTENARVTEAVALLDAGRIRELGPVLTAGHASLREDYRVSCPETDLAVDTALAAGALGARMTGGGFGGSVLVLLETADLPHVTQAVTDAFRTAGLSAPDCFTAHPSTGARRLA